MENNEANNVDPNKSSLGRSFSTVAIFTILSKIAGLFRDVVVASSYGAGVLADAYNFAFLYTGNILVLFGGLGGPFHSATVTTLTIRKSDQDSGTLIVQIFLATALVLSALAALLWITAPLIVSSFAPNYGSSKFVEQAVFQLRTMSPLIPIAGLIGISYGILNVFNRLFWPTVSPSIASAAIIIALKTFPNETSLLPLAVGSLLGAFGQLLVQLPDVIRCKLNYKISKRASTGIKEYLSLLFPAIIGTSIGQIILNIDSYYCFQIRDGQGVWTAIMNANRIIQLPLGVLITAMLVPILPRFAEQANSNTPEKIKFEFRRAMSFLWFVSTPLMMLLLTIPTPIVQALYERGAWHDSATELVCSAILFLAPSIVIYIGRDLITRVFYAYKDMQTPFRVGVLAIFLKWLLDWYFVTQLNLEIAGISLATSLITLFNFACLTLLLKKKIGNLGMTRLISPATVMFLAAIASGFAVLQIYSCAETMLLRWDTPQTHLALLVVKIAVTSSIGLCAYCGTCMAAKLEEPRMILKRIIR